MLQLKFTEEEIKELDYQRYHHPHPRVQRKMEALLLKAKGLPHHQIADCVGVCENTLRDYLQQYRNGGIEGLKRLEFYRPSSELENHRESLEAYFKEHPPASLPQAAACLTSLSWLSLVLRPRGSPSSQWTATIQCAGSTSRYYPSAHHGDQRQLHQ